MRHDCKRWGSCRRNETRRRESEFPSPFTVPALDPIDAIRWELLFTAFDGDPEAWCRYLEQHGSEEQRRVDLPFVLWLRRALERDPEFLGRMVAYVATEARIACV